MPRRPNPLWAEHTNVLRVVNTSGQAGSGTRTWVCKYCGEHMTSTITRVLKHLTGIGTTGHCGGCEAVPPALRDALILEHFPPGSTASSQSGGAHAAAIAAEDALQDALLGDIGGSASALPSFAGTSRKRARVSQAEDEGASASAATMLTDRDGSKIEVLITTEIVNEALHFYLGTYDLIAKTKSIDNEKAFLKARGSKFKYGDMIYSELELPLRLISQHLRVQKPPKYTKLLLHTAVVMALCVAEKRHIRCNYGKFILESLIEANLENSSKNKLYMSVGPMLTRIAYQALGMIEDLPMAGSQASLIQHARFVPKAVKTTTTAASSRTTRSTKKSSSDDERTDTNKDQDFEGSNQEDSQKETPGPSKHEQSDEEDTSTPLDKKSKKPRTTGQVLMDEAMARVEARRKELADARAAKATKVTKPMTMEETKKLRMEKSKALQEERRRLKAEQKAQEEAAAAQGAQVTKEKEIVDLIGTIENLKKIEREKHIEEQQAAQLAREKIKEALRRKAEGPILEPREGSPKGPRQEDEDDVENIQVDPLPSSRSLDIMPRRPNPLWAEHTNVLRVVNTSGQAGSGTRTWVCKYCGEHMTSTITRVLKHLTGIGTTGHCGGCEAVPPALRDALILEHFPPGSTASSQSGGARAAAIAAVDALQDALLGDIGGSASALPSFTGTSRKRARVSQAEDEGASASAASTEEYPLLSSKEEEGDEDGEEGDLFLSFFLEIFSSFFDSRR
ncbi:hypothetical protein L7F22_059207 [Adiantum nelumboides]|nr:hypothetical protein [Adiantum nelumboides]